MAEERQSQPEWLQVGLPPDRHARRILRSGWLAGLAVALTALVVAMAGVTSVGDPADRGGGSSDPPSTTPVQQPPKATLGTPVVMLGPTLPGAGTWDVYGRSEAEVIRLELGSGRMTRTPVPQLASDGTVTFLATATGVLARPVRPLPGYQVPDGEPSEPLPPALGRGGLMLPGPEPDMVWITSTSRYSSRGEMLLASLSSGWVRVQASLPAGASGSVRPDGGGSYYLGSTGGSYVRVPGGYRRLSTGTVLAATRRGLLTAECDQRLRCRHLLIDRRSGTRRKVRLLPSFDAVVTLASLSPNSRYAAVAYRLGTQSAALHLIDLKTGADQEVAARSDSGLAEESVVWSPTGRYLAAIGNKGRLVVIATATAQIVPLKADLPPILQVAAKLR